MSNLVSQIKLPAPSSHTKEETISTSCALEHQLHCLFLYNIVHPPLSRGLNTAHCFFLETVQANGFVSKSASSSSAANLQPLSELKSHSRTAENAAAFCYLWFLFGGWCVSVCVCPRAVIRTASGCWKDDVFSLDSTHTHTHSTVDLQLVGCGCSLESHTSIPHSPVRRFSFLTRSHRPPPPVPPLLFHTVSICCKLNPTQQVTWSHIQP